MSGTTDTLRYLSAPLNPPVCSSSMGSGSGCSTGQPSTCVQMKGSCEASIRPFPWGLTAAYSGTHFPFRTLLFFTSYFFSWPNVGTNTTKSINHSHLMIMIRFINDDSTAVCSDPWFFFFFSPFWAAKSLNKISVAGVCFQVHSSHLEQRNSSPLAEKKTSHVLW